MVMEPPTDKHLWRVSGKRVHLGAFAFDEALAEGTAEGLTNNSEGEYAEEVFAINIHAEAAVVGDHVDTHATPGVLGA